MPAQYHSADTIAAIASPAGPAARGIIRISGSATAEILAEVFESATHSSTSSLLQKGAGVARVHPGQLRIRSLSKPLPVDLYYWPNRRSYTGEPLAELHMVGSPPLIDAVLTELFAVGTRPAQPGEFTFRAFLTGRIDLMQAEAVLGVIDAGDEHELRTALEQLAGGISSSIVKLRSDLLNLLADLEAGLDFTDENLEFVSHAALVTSLNNARATTVELLQQADERGHSITKPRVVLAGPPNAGKSTLFNTLLGKQAALVSEVRGTTRDYLAANLTLGDISLLLIDTAGEETAATGIMQEAETRRLDQLERADLIIWCEPADSSATFTESSFSATDRPVLHVQTKTDLESNVSETLDPSPPASLPRGERGECGACRPQEGRLAVSAATGVGMPELRAAIVERLATASSHRDGQMVGSTVARCRESLLGTEQALQRALDIAAHEADQELLAIEIREALEELGKIVGAVYTDDILDRIFSKFCIGK